MALFRYVFRLHLRTRIKYLSGLDKTDGLPGVMTSLLQEIISVYTLLNPSQLTAAASNRVCNALALLQCVASHNETRTLFLNGPSPSIFVKLRPSDSFQPISPYFSTPSSILHPSRAHSSTYDSPRSVLLEPLSRTTRPKSSTSC